MKYRNILFVLSIVFLLSACNVDNSDLIPTVTGKAGELLVVVEKNIEKSKGGKKLRDIFQKNMRGLPQEEPIFDMITIPGDAFGSILKTHRNILRTKISLKAKKTRLTIRRDIWAAPQTVVDIVAPNQDSLVSLLEQNKEQLVRLFRKADRDRLITSNKQFQDFPIAERLQKKHKISMYVPKGYHISMDSTNFIWLTSEPRFVEIGILVYYYNYNDTSAFRAENLIYKRDSVLRRNVLGEAPRSYMTTEKKFPIEYAEMNFNDKYAVELRGLWKTEGNLWMGGPFMSITTVDEKHNRVVTVEGFVYSPKYDKITYMRQVESILYTLKFPQAKKE